MPKGFKAGGRTAGVPNKKTAEQINRATTLLAALDESIEVDIKALKAHERARLYIDLMEFVQPKLSRTEVKQEGLNEISIIFKRDK